MEIKAPKTVNDLRIRHFGAISHPAIEAEPDLEGMCLFISEALAVPYDLVLEFSVSDVRAIYIHMGLLYAQITLGDPPKEITLAGVDYRLIDPHKEGTGWHIDFSKADIKADPVRMACLFYYPKAAKKYGEKDANGNLLYPIADRYDAFRDHLPLEVFLNASAFFLQKTERSMRLSTANRLGSLRTTNLLARLTGRSSSTRSRGSSTGETGTK